MVKKNLNLNVEMNNGIMNIVENIQDSDSKVIKTIDINDPAIKGLYEATKDFIIVLEANNGNIGMNNLELTLLIKEVLEFGQSFKNMVGEKKKEMVTVLLNHIIETEINNSDLNETLKVLILSSVENIIDPAIELAIFVAKGNVKINKKAVKKTFRKICPCLEIN